MNAKKLQIPNWKRSLCLIAGGLMLSMGADAQTTKNYATTAVTHSDGGFLSGTYNVPDFANASDGNESTFATLTSTTAVALLTTNSYVEFAFPANVPTGSMVYIPVQDNSTTGILNTLLSGSLGNLITGLLSNKSFDVAVKKNSGTTVETYTSGGTKEFAGGVFNIVRGTNNQQYITFRPNAGADIRRIRITARTGGLVGASYSLNVQDAYYLSGAATPCTPMLTTSFDATGVSASLLTANGNPVQNPQFAIDADTTNFSTFGYGVVNLGVASTYFQDIYFSNLSKAGDQVKIKFRFPPSLLSASLLQNINIRAYNGNTEIFSSDLNSLLSVDLLGLITANLNSSLPAEVPVSVGNGTVQFDRIRISMTQLLGLSASQVLELYSVQRVPPAPTVAAAAISSCPTTTVGLSVTSPLTDGTYTWYNSSNAVVGTGTALSVVTPANGVTNNYYVTVSTCAGVQSVGTKVAVTAANGSCVAVAPVAYLQGAYSTTLNRNKDVTTAWANLLNVNATSQPYNTAGFGNYAGTESVAIGTFTSTAATDDILDWVLLELKDSTGNLVDRRAAFILENGNIVNLNKSANVAFKANAGKYHLTIRHRNHLGLSTELITFVQGANPFNFTSATDATIFGNSNAYVTVNGKICMIGGNANGNVNVRYNGQDNDRDVILAFVGGSEIGLTNNVYTSVDLNLDGTVRYNGQNNDRDYLLSILSGNEIGFIQEQIK
jgi:hypothetical protein